MKTILVLFLIFEAAWVGNAQDSNTPALHLSLTSPLDYQVTQRSTMTGGQLVVAGSIVVESKTNVLPDKLEVRVTRKSATGGDLSDAWQPLPCDDRVAGFRGVVNAPAGGWYRVEVRA